MREKAAGHLSDLPNRGRMGGGGTIGLLFDPLPSSRDRGRVLSSMGFYPFACTDLDLKSRSVCKSKVDTCGSCLFLSMQTAEPCQNIDLYISCVAHPHPGS